VLRPPPFPISIDQLTIDTLSTGLGVHVVEFSAKQIGADRGMLGEIFVLDLSYAPGASGPTQIVAKFAALRDGSLASARRGRAHERELRAFDELLGDTPVTTPANYGTWYDPDTAYFLLLQGAVTADHGVDQVVGLEVDDAKLVLIEIAKLHARWWNNPGLKALEWLPRLDGAGRIHNLTTLATAGWEPLCDLLGDELTADERALGTEFPQRLEAALRGLATLPSTFIHSDLRADNLLFSLDHRAVTLIDWQGCGLGPPGFDLAYFLTQSLTVDVRREHEDELLDFYRTELAAAGLELSVAEVRAGYGESMIYALTIACALPLISDPNEPRVRALASAFARRTIEAMRDHNQLWETS
jgi:hypothetical protein